MPFTRIKALLQPAVLLKGAPVLVALALSGLITYSFNSALRRGHVQVEHSMDALAAMDTVLGLLQDAETAQRGFVITGDDAYLAPYSKARIDLEPSLDALDGLVGRNTAQHAAVLRARAIARQKLDELEKTIAIRRRDGLAPAVAAVKRDDGKMLMDELRKELAGLKTRERQILGERTDEIDGRSRMIVWIAALALMIGLFGRAISAMIRMPSQFARSRDAADEPAPKAVTSAVTAVERHQGERHQGQSDEVAAIGRAP
jgi:CHASE3 domain sensor protein